MTTPWIEQLPPDSEAAARYSPNDFCQALFAGQICVRPFSVWVDNKWGFNAGALLEEALDRQKLFVESQYSLALARDVDHSDGRSLALRLICVPGEGLQVGLLGRVRGATPDQAENGAMVYWRELCSVLPYDYGLIPASTQDAFRQLAGWDLMDANSQPAVIEIKRGDAPLPTSGKFQNLPGFWYSGLRSNEQVWRALAAMPYSSILNISLQPAVLHELDQQLLWNIKNMITGAEKDKVFFPPLSANDTWGEACIKRRLAPWKKYFYLQVHLILDGPFDESLVRSIATAITRDSPENPLPGFKVQIPASADETRVWCRRLANLQITDSPIRFDLLADMDEAFSVFRLPHHAPLAGLPGVTYLGAEK